jgi:hypothetical protein
MNAEYASETVVPNYLNVTYGLEHLKFPHASIYLSSYLSIYLSILSIYLPTHPPTYLPTYLRI